MDNTELLEELNHLKRQLEMTVSLRYHLMPNVYPAFSDIKDIDIYADQIGLAGVGGDFFDFFRIDNDHIGIVVADIFDGGDAAALYMVAFKLYLMGELCMDFTPAEIIAVVNNRLAMKNEDNLCLSAWYGVYEISTGIITAVNAGHEAPLLQRGDKIARCENEKSSYLLAVMEGMIYESYEIKLNPGDRILLYTDGVIKASDEKGDSFTIDMMKDVLKNTENLNSEETVGAMQEALFSHIGSCQLKDDATFLCFRRGGEA